MVKYPTFIDSMDYPEPFYTNEYRYCKDYLDIFQDHSKISKESVSAMSDEALCYLFSTIENGFFEAYYDEEEPQRQYFILQEEMEKRKLFEDGYIIDAWRKENRG